MKSNTPSPEIPALSLDKVKIVWEDDVATLGQGCYAVAEVSYPLPGGAGDRRIETLKSAGLWDIDLKADAAYRAEVEREELDGLAFHLKVFGVPVVEPLTVTVEDGVAKVQA